MLFDVLLCKSVCNIGGKKFYRKIYWFISRTSWLLAISLPITVNFIIAIVLATFNYFNSLKC